jgi:predicted phosphodiesterase
MLGRGRELAAAVALLLALTGCRAEPAARPSPSPVTSPATPSPTPTPEKPYVVGVLGDYGVAGHGLREVIRLLAGWHPSAVFTTGDNAYQRGEPAEAAFARRALDPIHARVYAVLGNHDEYADSGRAVMKAFGIPNRWYRAVVGPVELVLLDANRPRDAAQLAFLRGVLAAPRAAAFRVVAFHQPAMSCSSHPADAGVDAAWVPLFHGTVDLVLSGHNHTYERFLAADGTPYVTTGGGGAALYPSLPGKCTGPGTVQYLRTAYHAVRLSVTKERLLLEAVGVDGVVFDHVAVTR